MKSNSPKVELFFFSRPNILPQLISPTPKWWNYSVRWSLLGSGIIQLLGSGCSRALLMLQTVCGSHCSMGWPWDRKNCIISFGPDEQHGAHLSSAGVFKHFISQSLRSPSSIACSLLQPGELSRKKLCAAVFVGSLQTWNFCDFKCRSCSLKMQVCKSN